MCSRCDDLEEEVAYLQSELAETLRADALDRLHGAMSRSLSPGQSDTVGGRGAASVALALYRARGRVVSRWNLLENVPPRFGVADDDRDPKAVDVYICRARKTLGFEAIASVWGRGYRMTPFGADIVSRLIGEATAPAEVSSLEDRTPEELRTLAAHIAGVLAHKDGDGGAKTATTLRRIADRLTGQPRVAA